MMTRHRPVGWSWSSQWRPNLFAGAGPISVLLAIGMAPARPAQATPQPEAIQGIPQQIVPQAAEVGLGNFTIQTGQGVFGGGSSGSSGGSGSTGSSGGEQTDSAALDTMLGQSWGAAAQQAAEGTGVNASALAATCVMESGCQNLTNNSGATGAFQMFPAAYSDGLKTALAADPSLASQIVPGTAGMNDPATESIAASGYLLQASQALQNGGVTAPTVLDARGYYEFGPTASVPLAQASDSDLMSTYVSNTALSNNQMPSTETVGQWRSSVASKLGSAASAPITA